MALHSVNLPDTYAQFVVETLKGLKKRFNLPKDTTWTESNTLSIAFPQEFYIVGVNTILEGNAITGAKKGGVRYLILDRNIPFADIAIVEDESGKQLKFLGISFGGLAESVVEGIAFAEKLDEFRSSNYDLRLLECHDIQFISLWMKKLSTNLFVPLWIDSKRIPKTEFKVLSEDSMKTLLNEKAKFIKEKFSKVPAV